jgi:multiple sugar transport system permease protein
VTTATTPAPVVAGTSPAPQDSGRGIRPSGWTGLAFIAPNLLGVVAFTLIPLISVIVLAFTNWNLVSGFGGISFNGLDNFVAIARDPGFWKAVGLTLIYVGVSVPLTVVLGLALGIALNRPLPGRAVLRAIFFLPYIVNTVAVGMTWLMLMNPKAGLVNQTLDFFGLRDLPGWFASSHWALPALIVMAVWGGVGYCSLIYLSALQDAPGQLYEAAEIDGAGAWMKFRSITWPSLLPTTIFLLVTLIIGASQGFGLIALITAGGPGDSTTTISYYMYQTGFQFYRFGYASAIGLVTFLGVLVLTLLTWRAQRGRALND